MKFLKLFLPLIVAAFTGLAMTFQGSINSALTKRVGLAPMSLVVHLIGLTLSLAIVLAITGMPRLADFKDTPWWAYSGGVLNVAIIGGVAWAIAQVGATSGISAILIGQLTTAVVLDHLGIFTLEKIPASWLRIVGILIMLIGARMAIQK